MHQPESNRREILKSLLGLTAAMILPDIAVHAQDQPATRQAPTGRPVRQRDRLGELLPQRRLGRTAELVTMLGVGGWHIGRMSEAEAQKTVETALAGGVRFFDTARQYQNGGSEERLGRLLVPKYRDVIFLMTKSDASDAAGARADLDGSLERLGTDHVDLWQMHAIDSAADVDGRIGAGVLDVMIEAKQQGKARHIGFTGHAHPDAHLHMLERLKERGDPLETCQMPVNVADPSYNSFILKVLPVLVERGLGVLAMKTLSNGGFFGGTTHGQHGPNSHLVPDRLSMADAIHFVWSLPVSVLISGPDNAGQIQEKIDLANSFSGMAADRRAELIARVSDLAGKRVEFYKA